MKVEKTLFVMRHAKSAWPDADMSDFDRPLLPKGLAEIEKVVQTNVNDLQFIEMAVSSSAIRALQTATALCNALELPVQHMIDSNTLYLPSVSNILRVVKELPDDIHNALIVSHNPGVTDFVNKYLPKPLANMSTAAIVCLRFKVETWANIKPGNLVKSWVDYPSNH